MADIYAALAAAQKDMENPELDKKNPAYKNTKYSSLAAILKSVRGPLNARGLMLNQTFENGDLKTIVWNEAGESVVLCSVPCPLNGNVQQMGGAITYIRRYSLLAAFGLVGDTDDDGNAACDVVSFCKPQENTLSSEKNPPSSGPFRVKCRSCGKERKISDVSRYDDFLKSDQSKCCPSPDWRVL